MLTEGTPQHGCSTSCEASYTARSSPRRSWCEYLFYLCVRRETDGRMLLGMYYNGYILFAIFIGHTAGYFLFGRDTCTGGIHPEGTGSGHCC